MIQRQFSLLWHVFYAAVFLTVLSPFSLAATPSKDSSILTVVPEYRDRITRNFNPFTLLSMPTTHEFIFEPLIIFNSLQNNKPEYRLATSYRLSRDLRRLQFTLRRDILWSDGKPFTANDVLYSYNLLEKHPELDTNAIRTQLKKVRKINQYEIEIELKQPNALAAHQLVLQPIVPKHQWEKIKDPVSFTNPTPIGTGPFTRITAMDAKHYQQCRNPHYWQADKLKIDCLRYPLVKNNDDFIARIVTGEFDWTGSFIPDIERHYASYSEDFHYWLPPASTISLMFNFKLADSELRHTIEKVEFRRAISMLVQRQLLIDIAAFGQGVPSLYASGMSQRFTMWADPEITEKYRPYMTFNPQLAADWLDYLDLTDKNNDGWRDLPSGKPLTLSILTPSGWTDFNTTALLLAEMLEDAGIRTRHIQTGFEEFAERLSYGDYVAALTNYPQGLTPYKYFNSGFNSAYQAPQYPRYAKHYFQDNEIDKLLAAFPTASTVSERQKIITQLNQRVASQQITVPLFNTVQFYQYNTQRFTGWFNEHNPVASPLVWPQAPERLLHVLALRPKEASH
ncbi:peptide ABC transporter substrate-binding protein [Photobacterium jeanii]|uniref:Peptide ABC transporter substrate-binding protein n=1 Tax=Photobacterium jeanii TaxID=858640 RepID=A0A178K9C9_9GAMM|nr:ABC transporter substrate-binding protein [Photobacterium jeanii]OAN13938.1 peptide ABC transporter substrate-binding protein [Photobacterium jeanii]PST89924.1 ABC transporter substrate-binding protein [Photobacterium jeanii]